MGEVSPSLLSQVAPRIGTASRDDSLRFVGLSATPSPRGSAPKTPIRLATVFSGIGAIEHALDRMNLNHKIIFACDNGDLEISQEQKNLLQSFFMEPD